MLDFIRKPDPLRKPYEVLCFSHLIMDFLGNYTFQVPLANSRIYSRTHEFPSPAPGTPGNVKLIIQNYTDILMKQNVTMTFWYSRDPRNDGMDIQ